jgi:hypothetical protein
VSESKHKERKHKRVTTREVTASTHIGDAAVTFTVVNLSIGGALVTGPATPTRGSVLDLELEFKGVRTISLKGQVVHVRAEGVGIAFQGVGIEEQAALEKLIASAEAKNALPPPLPAHRVRTDELPALVPRPDNAFFSEPDPRPPRGGSPDERADYLRALVKNRDETIKRARAAFDTVAAEADTLRTAASRLKARIDGVAGQQALNEVALASARGEIEKLKEAQLRERQTADEMLEQEQRRTLEAIATVSGLEASMRRHEMEAKRALEEAESSRQAAIADAAAALNVRKAREELMVANRKAMEAQTAFSKERAARQAAEKTSVDDRAAREAAERETAQIREEMARLKTKLVNAEAAIERMSTRAPAKPVARWPPAK